jgi:ribosomal protein S18 acetylase RimI-like enzyme
MASVRVATPSDRAQVMSVLTDAFSADPVVRWIFSDDDTYPARAETFFGFLFDVRVALGGAWITDGGESVALWSPPGDAADEWQDREWGSVADTFTPDERARSDAWDAAVEPHHPDSQHWYLGVLGTASRYQGRGLGPAVAGPGLAAANAAQVPAFLETAIESNVRLYERMGFAVTGIIDDPDLPYGWCMSREPA